ncbi:metal-dependent transcriptional regulator [Ileibacterium valens]|uniref:DtxR family transcriptional regulator n=2 Tax=Ileibacterium valens TaxID=1862668 RepID=A0A1U7NIH0_9FIRM|nr:metal-dependent transcriptional regulator [Ileibacterium valens]OLU39754.1 DtxR family transcriptional regulator [Erysipelotrichaceae bacterium NYU-BL-F16]OLU41997.1 DtxR family transcriptional regulator [Erysipelotrichaceae bacterium NYU-BL-E8]OLU42320.1 DtxR family transcriptional regulator [Ileibacterium valens]
MNKKLPLTESVEDYLESILVLSEQLDHVRSVDVASYLGFSKPSVSHAVKLLQEEGLLQIDPKKYLILTENGKEVAQSTYRRHLFFSEMLENIGVPRDIAQKDACRIEHIISEETFEAIQNFYQKAEQLESKRSDDSN